jgi:hypothetical protein
MTRSGYSALVKEAMSVRSSGNLLQRSGRKFVRNLIWWAVFFGAPIAILAAVVNFYLVGVLVFVGTCVVVMAAIMTVGELWSGAPDDPTLGSHGYPTTSYPEHPEFNTHDAYPSNWHGGGWDGGGGDGSPRGPKAAWRLPRSSIHPGAWKDYSANFALTEF